MKESWLNQYINPLRLLKIAIGAHSRRDVSKNFATFHFKKWNVFLLQSEIVCSF